jgi:hypothetical protein
MNGGGGKIEGWNLKQTICRVRGACCGLESQRDSGSKPKVARERLPWVVLLKHQQPQRGCDPAISQRGSHNRFAVGNVGHTMTQGRRPRANLGL